MKPLATRVGDEREEDTATEARASDTAASEIASPRATSTREQIRKGSTKGLTLPAIAIARSTR